MQNKDAKIKLDALNAAKTDFLRAAVEMATRFEDHWIITQDLLSRFRDAREKYLAALDDCNANELPVFPAISPRRPAEAELREKITNELAAELAGRAAK